MHTRTILPNDVAPEASTGLFFDDLPLRDLFPIPETYSLSESTARYYGSLTPPIRVIRQVRTVRYRITLEPLPPETHDLSYENPINVHLFKPKFYAMGPDDDEVGCVVPSREVLAHSLRSLAVFARMQGNTGIRVSAEDVRLPVREYCRDWQVADRVILCWKDSFFKFLLVHWLLGRGVSAHLVHRLICELENRLKVPDEAEREAVTEAIARDGGPDIRAFEEAFHIRHQPTRSPCVASATFQYEGRAVSVVQLSWGLSLSRDLLQAIVELNPGIRKVATVGGVGYVRNDGLELDDIFLPTGLVTGDHLEPCPFRNHIFDTAETTFFTRKKVATGDMKTVVPTVGILSNTAAFRGGTRSIAAFDMELEGFRDVLIRSPDIQHASAHYVMDLPFRGYSLGDTYYHRPYLERFFRTFNRGKYYCFERVLAFMAQD